MEAIRVGTPHTEFWNHLTNCFLGAFSFDVRVGVYSLGGAKGSKLWNKGKMIYDESDARANE